MDKNTEQLANIVGEMRDHIREKLESMEAEGVTCLPISYSGDSDHLYWFYTIIRSSRRDEFIVSL